MCIRDSDNAITFSVSGPAQVTEDPSNAAGNTASYTIGYTGFLAAGESASVNVSHIYDVPASAASPSADADFVNGNTALSDAITAATGTTSGQVTYDAGTGIVTFHGGSGFATSIEVTLTVFDDGDFEEDETFSIDLSDATTDSSAPVTIPTDSVVTTIISDEVNTPPTITFSNIVSEIPENTAASPGAPVRIGQIDITDDGFGTNESPIPAGAESAYFHIVPDVSVSDRYYVELIQPVDYETRTSLQITVSVNDTATAADPDVQDSFVLTVMDLNETAPVIAEGQTVSISEDAGLNSVHPTITFSDLDTIFTTFTWSITGAITDENNNGDYAGAFDIETFVTGTGTPGQSDDLAGRIRVLDPSVLDFDGATLPRTFILHDVVLTDDDSSPTLSSSPVDITIQVSDVNDSLPDFAAGQIVEIPEDAANSSEYGPIIVTDVDVTGPYTWTITSDIVGSDSAVYNGLFGICLLYTSPSPRD